MKKMKTTMMIGAATLVAFVAGTLVSCSPNVGKAPLPVPPVKDGSYTIGTK